MATLIVGEEQPAPCLEDIEFSLLHLDAIEAQCRAERGKCQATWLDLEYTAVNTNIPAAVRRRRSEGWIKQNRLVELEFRDKRRGGGVDGEHNECGEATHP